MTTPVLSIVTGTLNRPESFKRLLNSIVLNTSVSWELVVSDASDAPYDFDLPKNVLMIEERPRLGCTLGYNRAFHKTSGEYVLWLNDDCEVLPGYAAAAVSFMRSHPEVGLGALHYSENGSPFHVNSAWRAIYANFGIFPRELGVRVGFFDEDIIMYGCDNSFTFRVLLNDRGVSDIPAARVIHHSVKDQHRVENQATRSKDNDLLASRYMPFRYKWLETFNRLRVYSGEQPWIHGQPPSMISA